MVIRKSIHRCMSEKKYLSIIKLSTMYKVHTGLEWMSTFELFKRWDKFSVKFIDLFMPLLYLNF